MLTAHLLVIMCLLAGFMYYRQGSDFHSQGWLSRALDDLDMLYRFDAHNVWEDIILAGTVGCLLVMLPTPISQFISWHWGMGMPKVFHTKIE